MDLSNINENYPYPEPELANRWQDKAACKGVDPDIFFTDRGQSTAPGKAVCGMCIVVEPCLEYALSETHMPGIWGMTSERERRFIKRRRRLNGYNLGITGSTTPQTEQD